jgi:hypothetical protein
MTSSHTIEDVPELLVNKVLPAYMRYAICFQCQRTGHYKSFCPYYHCTSCKRPSPQHYPHNCQFHPPKDSPPYHSEDNDDEEEYNVPNQLLDDLDQYDDDLGGEGVWGNVMGEPAGL